MQYQYLFFVAESSFVLNILTMKSPRSIKTSRTSIPEHVKRAVKARDGDKCRNCGVVTEFLHYDHIFPHDLGGPTTVENIQRLCPTCNTSKGNKITCRNCGHWMSPEKSHCSQCGFRLAYTKYSNTLAGRLENLFQRVGRAVVVVGVVTVLLCFLTGGIYIYRSFGSNSPTSDQAATINQIVNSSFEVASYRPTSFRAIIPDGAKNARIVGGFKVISGTKVNFHIISEEQLDQFSTGAANVSSLAKREQLASARVRQTMQSGTYYLVFSSADPNTSVIVAAEFYSKYD
ncbi:MAG TPA: HNH endonuclease [Pyrinomonadaceae bacterium]|nr:HNH endonuclease [Pyrinomonadaceae bacterium]